MNKMAPGKRQCRNRQCLRHTKNPSGICDKCRELIFAKPKTDKKKRSKPIRKQSRWEQSVNSVWKLMSEVIRLRDTNADGFGKCMATNKSIWYYKDSDGRTKSNCDAGHYISRGVKSIMIDLDNVHAQFRWHNRDQGERKQLFRENLIEKIGLTRVERLERIEKQPWLHDRPDDLQIQAIKTELKIMKKELLKTKNW